MKKLNFGCGSRFSSGWVNVDFQSSAPGVISANFINGFPFPNDTFDIVYSSHVLEHFTEYQGKYLLTEAFRVLTKGGIIRIAVPDLEGTVKEYMRILDLEDDNPDKTKLYDWIILELLDQLVRTKNPSPMQSFMGNIFDGSDETMMNYIRSRTESKLTILPKDNRSNRSDLLFRIRHLTLSKLKVRFTYYYLILIGKMIPSSIKPMVFKKISIGEQHQWMYDRYSLVRLLKGIGFKNVRCMNFNESSIQDFTSDYLDMNPDGTNYKNNTLYVEGMK